MMLCDIEADHLMPICEYLREKSRYGKLTIRVLNSASQKWKFYLVLENSWYAYLLVFD